MYKDTRVTTSVTRGQIAQSKDSQKTIVTLAEKYACTIINTIIDEFLVKEFGISIGCVCVCVWTRTGL